MRVTKMPKVKYVLKKKMPRLYFKEYQGRNKPIWTDNPFEAGCYNEKQALRMKRRLACQSQVVSLVGVLDGSRKEMKDMTRLTKLKVALKPILEGSVKMPPFEIPDTEFFGKLDLNKPHLAYHYGWESAILECGEIIAKALKQAT